jgi:hypothetical protein
MLFCLLRHLQEGVHQLDDILVPQIFHDIHLHNVGLVKPQAQEKLTSLT